MAAFLRSAPFVQPRGDIDGDNGYQLPIFTIDSCPDELFTTLNEVVHGLRHAQLQQFYPVLTPQEASKQYRSIFTTGAAKYALIKASTKCNSQYLYTYKAGVGQVAASVSKCSFITLPDVLQLLEGVGAALDMVEVSVCVDACVCVCVCVCVFGGEWQLCGCMWLACTQSHPCSH